MISEPSSPVGRGGGGDPSESQLGRRMTSLLLMLAVIGMPAVVLRVLCIGNACVEQTSAASTVPFCSLRDGLRERIAAGFREGRSPEVLGVTAGTTIVGGTGRAHGPATPWPSTSEVDERVPIVFSGIRPDAGRLPPGTGLDDIAPTLAEVLGFDRPHPDVRSGKAAGELEDGAGDGPNLILLVVWKGIGTADLEGSPSSDWPTLRALQTSGLSTLTGEVGSAPFDPAAALTTIGTGGLPYQHGITSRAVLNDEGRLVRAWSKDAPVSVIASLADDWDEKARQKAVVGLVATDPTDQGVVGGNWYVDGDADRVSVVTPERILARAEAELRRGYATDEVADILAVVDEGPIERMDDNLAGVVRAARRLTDRLTVVVTATGSLTANGSVVRASDVAQDVEQRIPGAERIIEAAAPGGLYLDQDAVADEGISDDEVVAALEDVRSNGGGRLMDQVFPGLAVSFARYC